MGQQPTIQIVVGECPAANPRRGPNETITIVAFGQAHSTLGEDDWMGY